MTLTEVVLIAILFLILFITWPIALIAISVNSIDKQMQKMSENNHTNGYFYYSKESKHDAG